MTDDKGESYYKVKYIRKKKSRGDTTDCTYTIIVGDLEVSIIDTYISLFPSQKRTGRFLKRIDWTDKSKTKMVGTNQVIGINTLRAYPMRAAKLLGLKDPNRYTGHSWRRSTSSALAAKNFSLSNIKLVTGHRSDRVVQEYIDNSTTQKFRAAKALSTKRDYDQISFVSDTEDVNDSPLEVDNATIDPVTHMKRLKLPPKYIPKPQKTSQQMTLSSHNGAHQSLNFTFNMK